MEDQNAKHPAPGELELVRQFLNTHDVEEASTRSARPRNSERG